MEGVRTQVEFSFFPVEYHDFVSSKEHSDLSGGSVAVSDKISWFSGPCYKPAFPQFPG